MNGPIPTWFIFSVYGKIVIEDTLQSTSDNLIIKETKSNDVHIELPIYKDVLHKMTPPNEVESNHKMTGTNANDNILVEKEGKVVINTEINAENVKKCQTDIKENVIGLQNSTLCDIPVNEDNGTALILTPYIEKGQLDEARNASVVNSKVFLGVNSYSGFITVNKTYNSNIFFWYFPIENKPVNETPWIIWLQGGPGASSLTGLFDEIGPFKLSPTGVLKKNPYTWLQNHSLVFIDNPVGTGYSFTEQTEGFVKDMNTYGAHLHEVVQQLLQIYPELRSAPLYIAGESYAGKYVPALGLEIHKHKNIPGFKVNLQGLIIGNGYVDPELISQVTLPFYYFGLLNKEQIKKVDPLIKSFQNDIATNNSIAAKNKWNSVIAVLLILSHQKHVYNFLKDEIPVGRYVNFLKTSEVKRALHVGDTKFSVVNFTVNTLLAPDFLSSSKTIFEELLINYRVLAYCGNLDQMLPCVFLSEHYRTWKWNGSSEFLKATRYPYIYNSKLAGYLKTGGHLTEAVIRGAGHMVPIDEPASIQNLVTRWIRNEPVEDPFVRNFVNNYKNLFKTNNSLIEREIL
ncbi:unnamed protein product [Euphydryas editha]|uniref:Carboxypeptidase n=1 Tax=Euphydryas editha TaxID=104508 RepID=A0AAU9V279_EUPED|nr:unnamed protein product [Euphydryas editha]